MPFASWFDTYKYFGDPLYTYSLRQGIDDGFLAPYRVHRVVTDFDATGWRPNQGEVDRYGRVIPDEEYQTKNFERVVALRARTKAIARYVTAFLKKTDRYAKTIIFCVDQEHADEMRRELNNLNFDGGQVEIAAHMVYEINPDGHQLRMVKYTDYTAEKVRTLYPNAHTLRELWTQPENHARSSRPWRNAASTLNNWSRSPASRMRTRSTCCATSRSTHRCGLGGNVPSGCGRRRETSSRNTVRRPGPS